MSSGDTTKEGILNLFRVARILALRYKEWDGHKITISALPNLYFTTLCYFEYLINIWNSLRFLWHLQDMTIDDCEEMPTCNLVEIVHNK